MNKQQTAIMAVCLCIMKEMKDILGPTLQEKESLDAMWRKPRPVFVTLQENAYGDAAWRKAHPPFVPGPRILGAQAPGKVGHRQEKQYRHFCNDFYNEKPML